jgi:hypothetical protein
MRDSALRCYVGACLAAVVLVAGCGSGSAETTAPTPIATPIATPTPALTPAPTPVATSTPAPTPGASPDAPAAWVNMLISSADPVTVGRPPGWDFGYLDNGFKLVGPNGYVIVLETGPIGHGGVSSVADLAAASTAVLAEQGAVLTGEIDRTVCGVPGRSVSFTTQSGGAAGMLVIVDSFIHGEFLYSLLWQSPSGNEAADRATFQRFVDACEFVYPD